MNADLKNFLQPIAQVVATTLFVVFAVTFVSVPYVLQQHPGDAHVSSQWAGSRHMT